MKLSRRLALTETYGTPPDDPFSHVIAFALAFCFIAIGAMASFMGSLDKLPLN